MPENKAEVTTALPDDELHNRFIVMTEEELGALIRKTAFETAAETVREMEYAYADTPTHTSPPPRHRRIFLMVMFSTIVI